jgi:hypothetical protein
VEAEPPPYGGHGRRPKAPFRGVRARGEAPPARAWAGLKVRDGEKGPSEVESVARRVESQVARRVVGFEETLVVVRYEGGGMLKHDYHPSNAARETPPVESARVTKAAHRVEGCLKRCKSETGLGEYQVRNWRGWHHHQALSMIATWFLVVAARRGKKGGAGADGAAGTCGAGIDPSPGEPWRPDEPRGPRADPSPGAERVGAVLSLQGT